MENLENTATETPCHFYAATCMNWATAPTRQEAIAKVAKVAGPAFIREQVKHCGGLYVGTVKVLLSEDADYEIRLFQPVGVPMEDAKEYRIVDARGYVVPLD
ncbi:hypothetical protein [Anaeroselena agilis]|uniref:Uncharacterized protein n=1 Tax=Anaeroselena agilis TaxID=3063788 RepID=A0ABU3NUX4_9FIRM|nr:hypothetical protein [Selenomonadales bacterium 4137-cl]